MELTGRVITVYPMKEGTKTDGGTWSMREFLVEQNNRKKDPVLLTAWNQAAIDLQGKENVECEVMFFVSARQYKDRWYNQLTVAQIKFPSLYSDEKDVDYSQVVPPPPPKPTASKPAEPEEDTGLPF